VLQKRQRVLDHGTFAIYTDVPVTKMHRGCALCIDGVVRKFRTIGATNADGSARARVTINRQRVEGTVYVNETRKTFVFTHGEKNTTR
jgi:hypothetical protein